MKKLLLTLILSATTTIGFSQNLFSFGFDGTTAAMEGAGWERINLSQNASGTMWAIPATAPTTTFAGGGQAGGGTSFALVNYTSVASGAGTISNWLFTPVINVQNGDVVSFYTRYGGTTVQYPDNLQLRMSTLGSGTVNPSVDESDEGDYTQLLVEVNPNLDLTSYPTSWGQFSYTISGLSGATDVRFAFRYYVPDGGPTGSNSDIIGIDTFSVDRPLSTDSFFANIFSVYPNPANNLLNLNVKSGVTVNAIEISDINGRIVKSFNNALTQINVSDLNIGVYFMKVTTDQGIGTTKVVKN